MHSDISKSEIGLNYSSLLHSAPTIFRIIDTAVEPRFLSYYRTNSLRNGKFIFNNENIHDVSFLMPRCCHHEEAVIKNTPRFHYFYDFLYVKLVF